MARAAVAAALFLFLTVAFVNTSDLPPVDQDGSGDDDDSFSGSGFEPLLEEEFAHGDSADKPTDASLTSAVPYVPTENQHPMVEPERPEENEAGTVSTTSAVVTELIPSPGQPEQDDNIPDEETAADKGSAVVIVPTTGPTVQPDTVKMDVPHDVPEVHNIPQDQTTESVRHATDTIVDPSHHDGTSTTEATEPHKHHHHHSPPHHHHNHTTAASLTEAVDTDLHHVPHHVPHHHHHHHHNHTTAASVTEAVDTDLHHVPHHVPHHRTSAPSVTHSLDTHLHPAIQEDIRPTSAVDPHMDHPHDSYNVTESNVEPHSSTPDANLLEDSIGETTTIGVSHGDNRKINIPVVVFEAESEPEHTDSPEFEASGGSLDTNDFVFEPSIPRAHVPDNKIEVEDDGMSDTSKGIMEQKGVLAAVIAGGVAGLAFAVCLVGFMLYRMKKKDEGSYCLEETKQTNGGYEKPLKQEEFYA